MYYRKKKMCNLKWEFFKKRRYVSLFVCGENKKAFEINRMKKKKQQRTERKRNQPDRFKCTSSFRRLPTQHLHFQRARFSWYLFLSPLFPFSHSARNMTLHLLVDLITIHKRKSRNETKKERNKKKKNLQKREVMIIMMMLMLRDDSIIMKTQEKTDMVFKIARMKAKEKKNAKFLIDFVLSSNSSSSSSSGSSSKHQNKEQMKRKT